MCLLGTYIAEIKNRPIHGGDHEDSQRAPDRIRNSLILWMLYATVDRRRSSVCGFRPDLHSASPTSVTVAV